MSSKEKSPLDKKLDAIERRDASLTGNRALEKCFDKCVESFRSKKLSENERICLENCTSLYLDTVNRVYKRFEEMQIKEKPQ